MRAIYNAKMATWQYAQNRKLCLVVVLIWLANLASRWRERSRTGGTGVLVRCLGSIIVYAILVGEGGEDGRE